ncbi:MAG: EAL domain-containing protein, partial [Sulfuriferula sp.]
MWIVNFWRELKLLPRVLSGVVLIVVTTAAAVLLGYVWQEQAAAQLRAQAMLRQTQNFMQPSIVEHTVIGDYASIKQSLQEQADLRPEILQLTWQDKHGVTVVGTDFTPVQEQSPAWFRHWAGVSQQVLVSPISYAGQAYGELEMIFNPAVKNNQLWQNFVSYVSLVLIGVLLIIIFVYIALRRSVLTIDRLVVAVGGMQEGNYDSTVPEQGSPELRTLVHAFNDGNLHLNLLIATLRQRDLEQAEQLKEIHEKNFALQEQHRAVSAAAILAETDLAGDITYINDKLVEVSGYRREELLGQNHRMLNSGVHTHMFFDDLWQTIAAGKVWHGEICNRAKDGHLYWVDTTIVPILDETSRQPVRYKAIRFDITARKLAENNALQVSQQLQSMMQAAIEVAIIATDIEGVIRLFNPGAEHMLGYRAEDLVGKETPAVFHLAEEVTAYGAVLSAEFGREIAGFDVFITKALIDGQERREWTYVRKDGVHIQVSLGVTPVWDIDGQVTGYLGIALDVTQHRALESALYLEKERAEVTLASIGDAVLTTDAEGNVTFINQVAQQYTGWSQAEAAGQRVEQVLHIINENSRQLVENPVREVLRDGVMVALANHTVLIARDGTEYAIEDSAAPIFMSDGSLLGCVLVFHDVTEKYRLMRAVQWQAGHDVLTNLPNRALLNDRFSRALAGARRSNTLTAVCLLDLDAFKPINDVYGHEAGDVVLIGVAQRLSQTVRGDDTVARLGGDEFVLLLNNFRDIAEVEETLHRVLLAIAEPYAIGEVAVTVNASVGFSIYPLDDADADTLMRHADQAMYQAKQLGRNRYCLFDLDNDVATRTSLERIQRVREALHQGELVLHYQPKVNMRTGTIQGMEALLRWQHPQLGLVPPLEFLPLVEQTDLIIEIGIWVMEQALQQISAWLKLGHAWEVSVNIAGLHFQRIDFCQHLAQLLARYPEVPSRLLEIEILESATIGDLNTAQSTIEDCQQLGVRVALDDFGTGYSSLSYLKRLPADVLKIDQSFVRDMLTDKSGMALVEAVIGLANVFNSEVIAEGVETTEHGVLLLRLGCDYGQGYGIARPMPVTQVLDWAQHWQPDSKWKMWSHVHWDIADFPLLVA